MFQSIPIKIGQEISSEDLTDWGLVTPYGDRDLGASSEGIY